MERVLKQIIADFHAALPFPEIKERDLDVPLKSGKVVTIMGPRRSGKTFYLRSIINGLAQKISAKRIVYVNFEDERLSLGAEDLQSILDAHIQLYPDVNLSDCWFFFDEIQIVDRWERFVRRLEETVSQRIFLTGSSSELLSTEIATSLRGRTITYTLLPLSFREYARFRKLDVDDLHSTRNENQLTAAFDRFITRGGFPEVVEANEELHRRILQSYEDIMIYRDVIERHQVKRPLIAKDLMNRLLNNTARMFSVNKYYNDLKSRNITISKDTLYDLMDYLSDAFAVFLLRKWAASVARREQSAKKVYVPDTGMITACTFQDTKDVGHLLETTVYLEMAKREYPVFYYRDSKSECDFVAEWSGQMHPVQVCYELTDKNRDREIGGLIRAADRFGVNKGWLLTRNQTDTIEKQNLQINVQPAWKWALKLE